MHGVTLESHTLQTVDGTIENLGMLLRRERRARKLSQEQVASSAGVARATLNRWEGGAHLPRLPELNAVLDALDASSLFRNQALSLIHAPRAHQILRTEQMQAVQEAPEQAWIFTPETGDLLRTMRLRQGMTQEYIADQMGIRRTTISRWETGDVIPSVAHLNELLSLLAALPEERTALTRGTLVPSRMTADTNRTFEEVHAHYDYILWKEMAPELEPLKDLEFLRLERALADLIPYHPDAKHFLGYTYSYHSNWLAMKRRYREAAVYADRVIEAAHQQVFPVPDWQGSILTAAQCAVYSGGQVRPERGIQMLQDWLPLVDNPAYAAWILSDMAKYQAQAGQLRSALDIIARSCRVVLGSDNPVELRVRRTDRAELLLRTEQPENAQLALDLLPVDVVHNTGQRLREELCWSKGLLQLGEVREARKWLERAEADVHEHNLDPISFKELAQRFAGL